MSTPLLIGTLLIAIVLIVVLIVKAKLHAFIALSLAAIFVICGGLVRELLYN